MSDFDIIGQDPLLAASPVSEPVDDQGWRSEGVTNDSTVDEGATNDSTVDEAGATVTSRNALELADQVERLVQHLRELSRRNRRIGTDVELSKVAADALRRARVVQGRPVPDER